MVSGTFLLGSDVAEVVFGTYVPHYALQADLEAVLGKTHRTEF